MTRHTFKQREKEGRLEVFDPIRKKWLRLTPEERVRQQFVLFLLSVKNIPASHIAVEKAITVNGLKRRYDVVVFDAAGKPLKIKWAPIWLFGILANLPKIKKAGKHDIILFSRWTLSHDLVGDTMIGEKSFAEYIKNYFRK